MVLYPEPSLVSAVVRLALLLSLPPLDQAGGVVTRKADVTAAGGGTDSSTDASEKEWLGAEQQLHPIRQCHEERAVGADPVRTLSVVCIWKAAVSVKHCLTRVLHKNHTCTCEYINSKERCEKQLAFIKTPSREKPMRRSGRLRRCGESGFLFGGSTFPLPCSFL